MSESEGDDNDIIVAEEVTVDTQFPHTEESANTNQNQNRSGSTSSNRGRPDQSSTSTSQNTNARNENPDRRLRNSGETNSYANSSATASQERNARSNHTRSMNDHGESNSSTPSGRSMNSQGKSNSSTPSASAELSTAADSQSSLDSEMNVALTGGSPVSELSSATPAATLSTNNNSSNSRSSAVGSVRHVDTNGIGSAHASSPVGICRSFGECIVIGDEEGSTHSNGRSTHSNERSSNSNGKSRDSNGVAGSSNNRNRSSSSSSTSSSSSQSHPSTTTSGNGLNSLSNASTTVLSGNGFSTSSKASTIILSGNGFSTSSDPSTIFPSVNVFSTSTPVAGSGRRYSNCDRISEEGTDEEEEEVAGDWESYRRRERKRMGNVAGSIFGYAPLVVEGSNEGEGADPLEELYVPISGFEVMEQRAKFTVFKLHVQKSANEGYFIFRRYTDFTRLNNKLKLLYPGFRLALPPKKWFGNNFDPIFLEDRMLGLQAFLNNITGHKDIKKSGPVREFLCINDPPGPHDSLEESRVMVESLEGVVYNLKRELADRDRVMAKKDAEIARLKARIQELENAQVELPGLPVENERVGTDQESESSTVEGDRRSCVEADLSDHGNSDHDNGFSENTVKVKVQIEPLGNHPDLKSSKVIGEGDTVAMAISHSAAPVVGDSR